MLADLRFALRQFLKTPGFSLIAVATLALAIGANATIFSLLDQALMRALPVKDPDQLVVLSFAGSRPGIPIRMEETVPDTIMNSRTRCIATCATRTRSSVD